MTTATELKLDYFKVYDAANAPAGQVVGLEGQFDHGGVERAQLTYLNAFANPVSKNGEKFHDKNAHLTWYDIFDPTPDPTRLVTIENQFGKQVLYTGRACALLVPTQKIEPESRFPVELDHYKVYQVLQAEPVFQVVKLEDQFHADEHKVYDPRFFAVPVKKYFEGQTYGIYNKKAHLAIYAINPASFEKTVMTLDQFGRRYLQVFRGVLLAAPSVKLEWKEV